MVTFGIGKVGNKTYNGHFLNKDETLAGLFSTYFLLKN